MTCLLYLNKVIKTKENKKIIGKIFAIPLTKD